MRGKVSASGKCEQAAEAPVASAMGEDKSCSILPGRSYTVNSQESPPRVPGCGDNTGAQPSRWREGRRRTI
jgi:hypothetical protein